LKNTLNSTSVNIYATCEDIPLWNFYKFSKTNELKYFTKELVEVEGLEEVKVALLKEYFELTKDKAVEHRISIMDKIMTLSNKFDSINLIIYAIKNFDTRLGREMLMKHVGSLEQWNYKIKPDRDLIKQLDAIENRLNGIKTKIALLESEDSFKNSETSFLLIEALSFKINFSCS